MDDKEVSEILKQKLLNRLYLEVPDSWLPTVRECIMEIYNLFESKGMRPDNVQFFQIKEKYNTLRVYYDIPMLNSLMRTNFTDPEPALLRNELNTKIDEIIDRYDKIIQNTIVKQAKT